MNKYITLTILALSTILVGCDEQIGGYIAASSISKSGFARNRTEMLKLHGEEIRVWGYVDHSNMYGDADTKRILKDWWSGEGPNATTWRFGLKAKANDSAGHSITVHVPNGNGRDKLLKTFLADARAGRPTRVFVKGKIFAFDAPMNFAPFGTPLGLYIEAQSCHDILCELPEETKEMHANKPAGGDVQ